MGGSSGIVYEFGGLRLDPRERLLLREEGEISIEPIQFSILTVLVRNAGRIVTREELLATVWPGVHVTEGSLHVAISILRKALGETPEGTKFIETIRKTGYRLGVPVRLAERSPTGSETTRFEAQVGRPLTDTNVGRKVFAARMVIPTALLVALSAGLAWLWVSFHQASTPHLSPKHGFLTTYQGTEIDPSFSPDGDQVVFSWKPPSKSFDIYALPIGQVQPFQLTTDPGRDEAPAWSPDGRQIAFIRDAGRRGAIFLVSAAGGAERKLADTKGVSLSWSRDSKSLAVSDLDPERGNYAIYTLSVPGAERSRLTFPDTEPGHGDRLPAFAPDGNSIAFVRRRTVDVSDIFLLSPIRGRLRQITFDKRRVTGFAWTPDSKEIVFSSNRQGQTTMWRISISGGHPEPISGVQPNALSPAIARSENGWRLVYQHVQEDYNISMMDLQTAGQSIPHIARGFASSSHSELSPVVSPDGRTLAFVSDRSGHSEVWSCDIGGESCWKLTSIASGQVGSPGWSPDGKWIAFDARVDGNADLYLIRSTGGQPVRLTSEPSVEAAPSWCLDGESIYFRSDRTGRHEIWKTALTGSETVQVTHTGGFEAFESPDGKYLYFVKASYSRGLWRIPIEGGSASLISEADTVTPGGWAVGATGIYWLDFPISGRSNPPSFIKLYRLADRKVIDLGTVQRHVISSATGLSVTKDERWLLWSQLDRNVSDLAMIEGFR
jgi:Tol biopolymer transport system component/DNA-binding winged helix-turn-helix (wHTH) protein